MFENAATVMSSKDGGGEDAPAEPVEIMKINAHVHGYEGEKVIPIPCGTGPQSIKWLGHVAIARYDEEEYQGWVKLGVPTRVCKVETGEELPMEDIINSKLAHDDHVEVSTSMFSKEDDKSS